MTADLEEHVRQEDLQYTIALTDSTEFGEVLLHLAELDPKALRAKLEDVLAGPVLPSDEDASAKNRSRNILFELSLASKLKRAGFKPRLGDRPDLVVDVDHRQLCLECKRPFSEKKVADRIEEAGKSLREILDDVRTPRTARGVVAISLSKVMNDGDKQFVYANEIQGRSRLDAMVTALGMAHAAVWKRLDDRILAVLFHVITPAFDKEADRDVVAQQMIAFGRARGFFDQQVARTLRERLESIRS